MQTDTVASFNELADWFRQRQADAGGDPWYGGSGSAYENGIDQWIQWPDWLNPGCQDRYSALDAGRCCRDSGSTAIRVALNLADLAQEVLGRADAGRARTAADLAPLAGLAPQVVAAIRGALAGADRPLTVQLDCALRRVSLFTGRLDRGPELAPLREQIRECSDAIWDALHPRDRAERIPVRT